MGNNDAARDAALREILISTDPDFRNEDALAVTVTEDERPVAASERVGNSMQDLRLSVKGWRFGQEIGNGAIQSRQEAADWLRREIYDASNTR